MERTIRVRFLHPETGETLTVDLPADIRIGALNGVLYDHGFVYPQKPGYGFVICGHLCGAGHTLEQYLTPQAGEVEIQVFGMPQIMV